MKILVVFYKVLFVIYGLDFGFFSYRSTRIRYTVNFLSFVKVLILGTHLAYYTYYTSALHHSSQYIAYILQYIACTGVSMCINRDVTLSACAKLFDQIDSNLKVDRSFYKLELKNLSVMFALFATRILFTLTYCFLYSKCHSVLYLDLIYFIMITNADISLINSAFVYYEIRCRLTRLVWLLKESDGDVVSHNILYRDICDIALKIKRAYEPLYTVNLMFNVPALMTFIYYAVVQNKNIPLYISLKAEIIISLIVLSLTFLPAIIAGTLSNRAEEIKIILHNKLLQPQDETKALAIQRFIRYVETRPLKFKMLHRTIPLNCTLAFRFLSLCVTYLIVVLQLTHEY